MSKVEGLKEAIGWLKAVFVILVAIDVSLVGWVVQNYDTAPVLLRILCLATAVVIGGGIVWVNVVAYRKIYEIYGLEKS